MLNETPTEKQQNLDIMVTNYVITVFPFGNTKNTKKVTTPFRVLQELWRVIEFQRPTEDVAY